MDQQSMYKIKCNDKLNKPHVAQQGVPKNCVMMFGELSMTIKIMLVEALVGQGRSLENNTKSKHQITNNTSHNTQQCSNITKSSHKNRIKKSDLLYRVHTENDSNAACNFRGRVMLGGLCPLSPTSNCMAITSELQI